MSFINMILSSYKTIKLWGQICIRINLLLLKMVRGHNRDWIYKNIDSRRRSFEKENHPFRKIRERERTIQLNPLLSRSHNPKFIQFQFSIIQNLKIKRIARNKKILLSSQLIRCSGVRPLQLNGSKNFTFFIMTPRNLNPGWYNVETINGDPVCDVLL